MAMRNIKMMVKDKVVRLKFYREGERFYETECGFVFPCPCRTWVMRPFWLKIRLYFLCATFASIWPFWQRLGKNQNG